VILRSRFASDEKDRKRTLGERRAWRISMTGVSSFSQRAKRPGWALQETRIKSIANLKIANLKLAKY
jgi:hypothetical protein